MSETKSHTYTVCGFFCGRHISVPGHASYHEAKAYASLKGWGEIRVIKG